MLTDEQKQTLETLINKLLRVYDWDLRQRTISEAEEANIAQTINQMIADYGVETLPFLIKHDGRLIHPKLSEGLQAVQDDGVQVLLPVWVSGTQKLIQQRHAKAVEFLRSHLTQLWAINTLNQFDAPELMDDLMSLYQTTSKDYIREHVQRVLGKFGTPEAVALLAQSDQTPETIDALAQAQTAEAVTEICKILRTTADGDLKEHCIRRLGDIIRIDPPQIVSLLQEIIVDTGESLQIRKGAIYNLGRWHTPDSVQALMAVSDQVENETLKSAIYKDIIGHKKRPEVVEWMREQLNELAQQKLKTTTIAHFISLVEVVGQPEHFPILEKLATQPEDAFEQRRNAIYALGRIGGTEAVALLDKLKTQVTQRDGWNRIPDAIDTAKKMAEKAKP